VRLFLAALLCLLVASSSAQPEECAKLRQDASQFALQLLSGLYANPNVTEADFSAARAELDRFKGSLARCEY
jgi:hypothetical protein